MNLLVFKTHTHTHTHKFIILQFWSPEVWNHQIDTQTNITLSAGLVPFGVLRGNSNCLFSFKWPGFLGLVFLLHLQNIPSKLASNHYITSLSVVKSASLLSGPLWIPWTRQNSRPGGSLHRKILNFITSTKSLFPCKVTYSWAPGIRKWTPAYPVSGCSTEWAACEPYYHISFLQPQHEK